MTVIKKETKKLKKLKKSKLSSTTLKPKKITKRKLKEDKFESLNIFSGGCPPGGYTEGCLHCVAIACGKRLANGPAGKGLIDNNIIECINGKWDWTNKTRVNYKWISELSGTGKVKHIMLTYMGEISSCNVEFLTAMFHYAFKYKRHDFVFITKFPSRLKKKWDAAARITTPGGIDPSKMRNIHVCASIESAKYKYKIDELREFDVINRHLFLKPLLDDLGELNLIGIDSVRVSKEVTIPKCLARECKPEWVARIRHQALEQDVDFYLDKY